MGNDRNRRKRDLTQAEAELWAEAMRDAVALRRRRRAAANAKAHTETLSQAALKAEIEKERAGTPQPASPPPIQVSFAVTPSAGRAIAARPGTLDRRQTRMIATGRAEIDARLDLHGLRQDEAYRVLRNFVATAQARRARVVLVITGKGKTGADAGGEREVGVLRRLVPMWLREPELSGAVVAYGPADIRHGGAGALYVQLRKLR